MSDIPPPPAATDSETHMSPPHADGAAYWLLTGDVPAGPFPAAQLHAMLAARAITRQARACRVGDSAWRPLGETPGFLH